MQEIKKRIPQYSIVRIAHTLMDKKTGSIIAPNCDVVILDYRNENTVLVCAFGNYMKSVETDINLLTAYTNGK
jgi:hypothetical protein